MINKNFSTYLFFALAIILGLHSFDINAQQSSNASSSSENNNLAPTRKYKKARALQSSTAKKMAKVYEALENVDELLLRFIHYLFFYQLLSCLLCFAMFFYMFARCCYAFLCFC